MNQTHIRETPIDPAPHPPAETGVRANFCPRFHYAVELLGRRWIGAIIRVLMGGPRRFNELLGAVPGLSDRLLTERLRELEREGIVARTVHDERPVRVTYTLTESGESLGPILDQISDWAERWVEFVPVCPQSESA
jgi:DNA-binding HxlR family transcriptional regulator